MSSNESNRNWVDECIEYINKAIPNIEEIKLQGQIETKRGLEKIKEADRLLTYMQYLRRILEQNKDKKYIIDPKISATGAFLNNQLGYFSDDILNICQFISNLELISAQNHSIFMEAVSSTDGSSGSAVILGARIEQHIQSLSPTYKPVFNEQDPGKLFQREERLDKLITLLSPFDEKYTEMVKGSEITLFSTNPDSKAQAAHSMRECFDEVLKELAPTTVVKTQPWFVPTPEAPGRVSRRSRLQYILYGSGENVDESILQRYDDLARLAINSLDCCIGPAHDHTVSLPREIVQLAIDQARISLIEILTIYNEFRKNQTDNIS